VHQETKIVKENEETSA